MKKLILKHLTGVVFIICFTNVVSFGQTQMEMNTEAGKNYKKSDAKLAIVYKKVQKETQGEVGKKLLLDAQRTWIKYKEAHCKSASAIYEGGSMQPLIYLNCLTEITTERIKQLNNYLIVH